MDGSGLPELRIDGFLGGLRVASARMSADTTRDRLWLAAEDRAIEADGTDATRITFRALDAYGNQRPHVTGEVTLAIDRSRDADRRQPVPVRRVRRGGQLFHPFPARPDGPGEDQRQPPVAGPGPGAAGRDPACPAPAVPLTGPFGNGRAAPL